jgi:2-C-methyl-D-erythritol 4-phosphate cytidylyltransferase
MINEKVNLAIIPAAGQGRRMKSDVKKQYIQIEGKPILYYTLEAFQKCDLVDGVILVVNKDELTYCQQIFVENFKFSKVINIVEGGKERQNSVYNGLKAIDNLIKNGTISACNTVSIHDAARPMISSTIIKNCILEAEQFGAACSAVRVKDTIKVVDNLEFVDKTLDRSVLWSIHTPQTFKFELIYGAHRVAEEDNYIGTDDCSLVEHLGKPVKIVEGDYKNIKVTTPEDIELVKLYRY